MCNIQSMEQASEAAREVERLLVEQGIMPILCTPLNDDQNGYFIKVDLHRSRLQNNTLPENIGIFRVQCGYIDTTFA